MIGQHQSKEVWPVAERRETGDATTPWRRHLGSLSSRLSLEAAKHLLELEANLPIFLLCTQRHTWNKHIQSEEEKHI